MPHDIRLSALSFVSEPVVTKLHDLAIDTIRQLFERLKKERSELKDYLRFSDKEFADFYKNVQDVIQDNFPEDSLSRIRPAVNKRGVAVDRLHDPSRPRYYKEGNK